MSRGPLNPLFIFAKPCLCDGTVVVGASPCPHCFRGVFLFRPVTVPKLACVMALLWLALSLVPTVSGAFSSFVPWLCQNLPVWWHSRGWRFPLSPMFHGRFPLSSYDCTKPCLCDGTVVVSAFPCPHCFRGVFLFRPMTVPKLACVMALSWLALSLVPTVPKLACVMAQLWLALPLVPTVSGAFSSFVLWLCQNLPV